MNLPPLIEQLAELGQVAGEPRCPEIGQGLQEPVAGVARQIADGVEQRQRSGMDPVLIVDVLVEDEVGDPVLCREPADVGVPGLAVERGEGAWESLQPGRRQVPDHAASPASPLSSPAVRGLSDWVLWSTEMDCSRRRVMRSLPSAIALMAAARMRWDRLLMLPPVRV